MQCDRDAGFKLNILFFFSKTLALKEKIFGKYVVWLEIQIVYLSVIHQKMLRPHGLT